MRCRRLVEPLLLAWVIALTGCGPKSSSDDGATQSSGDDPTSTSSAGTTEATTEVTTAATTEPVDPNACPPDGDLCRDYCLNLQAKESDCSRADVTCFDWCMRGFYYSDLLDGCGDEARAALLCLADADYFDGVFSCESTQCTAEYLVEDVCRGWCGNLSGNPFSGGSQSECNWGSDCSYGGGHTIEMVCSLGDAPTCSCWIDDAEVGTCALGIPLKSFDCGGEDFHVLKGCCNDFFLPVLDSGPARECIQGPPQPVDGDPSGTTCPLRGMYVPCLTDGAEGRAFCDMIGGEQVFGPCLVDPECELAGDLSCGMHCELIEGVPTWVQDVCDTSTSG